MVRCLVLIYLLVTLVFWLFHNNMAFKSSLYENISVYIIKRGIFEKLSLPPLLACLNEHHSRPWPAAAQTNV
jgi:hypothetical protein